MKQLAVQHFPFERANHGAVGVLALQQPRVLARGCYFVLVAALVAAAVNRIVLAQRAASE